MVGEKLMAKPSKPKPKPKPQGIKALGLRVPRPSLKPKAQ